MRVPQFRSEHGFSLTEMLIAVLIMLPVMAGAFSLFSVAIGESNTEQDAVALNQDARAALELMSMEIAQAGSHRDVSTTSGSTVNAQINPQSMTVASSSGFNVGDDVEVGVGNNNEIVKLTAVGTNSISGVFRVSHANGVPVRLYAQPYLNGVLPPPGLGPNSSATTTVLRFFGDMNGDGNMSYVEYRYDAGNSQITRSMTPITQGFRNPALPLVTNVKPNTVRFTLYTDSRGVVTSVGTALEVLSAMKTGSKQQETALSSRVAIPSAVAASILQDEYEKYGGLTQIPPMPANVLQWSTL
jgi:prepilin-type N-terminal cleavage/methylation domain-containing protein